MAVFYGRASSYLVSRGQCPSPQGHLSHRRLTLLPETLLNGRGSLLFGGTENLPGTCPSGLIEDPPSTTKLSCFSSKGPQGFSQILLLLKHVPASSGREKPNSIHSVPFFLLGCGPALVNIQYMGPNLAKGPGEVADIFEGEWNQARGVQGLKEDKK